MPGPVKTNLVPGSVNTNWGPGPNAHWGPGPVNTNLVPWPVNTNLVPGPVNTNWRPGPWAKQRAGGREIQIPGLIPKSSGQSGQNLP